ncbi:(2Fe-2S)-binding protein [Burkholderia multivorans]|jgi:aerobic-type carbon monoxide dehydrogenase small subunit (CoxS/CutS family)|uniref:[2Fe-2S] binding domain protein n=3 Tax=Burkholderia multivorans TaxID=87883 RepID=B9BI96_9BURK|nr:MULTISPECIES: (2Fe-2S)-binding protein [Burkholderia]AJY15598.1 [2Fe-2S] binding domain protein [Burkholderia multivorans ATCC BAA-247]AOJ95551.1 (2Fe-2S)-binding protein [Burkholderia multivorans]AVR19144.1 (2Fe-2S)-binding protein [Burkholderia multivorans]EEE03174.1 [2Fe-2S] binding domain protein [Burkholderia multivorans CGD1]EEE09429.1 [2Fe-2S] binding domain protein [Burkholderia multivorans CGD2]
MTTAQTAASGASAAAAATGASAPNAASAAPAAAAVERPLVRFQQKPLSVNINGKAVGPMQVPEGLMMIEFLHEYAGLTGSRLGCGQGICHACVVILDKPDGTSEEVRTCITGAHFFHGRAIRTVEGHAKRNEAGEVVELSPIQQKFLEHFSFQCGYCTPGFVNAATVLIERLKREPVAKADVERTITEALNAHLCRCTGYVRYYEAVKDVVMTTPGLVKDAA